MEQSIRPVNDGDAEALVSIYNYYVENSFAAYFAEKVNASFLMGLKQMSSGYPFYVLENQDKEVAGFGLIHRYHRAGTLNRTAELTYFIAPAQTRQGLGIRLLTTLTSDAKSMGIDNLLANISSLNQASLDFHQKFGFRECGRFIKVGRKFGQDFDIVWMQKELKD